MSLYDDLLKEINNKVTRNREEYESSQKERTKSDSRRKAYNSKESTKAFNNVLPTRKQYTPSESINNDIEELPVAREFKQQLETGKRVEIPEEYSLPTFTDKIRDKIKNYDIELAKNAPRVAGNIGYGLANGLIDFNSRLTRASVDESNKYKEQFDKISDEDDLLQKLNQIAVENMDTYDNVSELYSIYSREKNGGDKLTNELKEQKQINNQKIQENIENSNNPIAKKMSELTPSIGQMLPSMVPYAGLVYSTGSAQQSYYEEAKERGMSEEDAKKYGNIMGSLEGVTEFVGGKLTKAVGKNIAKGSAKQAGKMFALDVLENVGEEAVMEPLSELTTKITGGDQFLRYDYNTADGWKQLGKDMLDSGIDGGLISIIMGGASAGIGSSINVVNKISKGQKVSVNELNIARQEVQNNIKNQVVEQNIQDMQKVVDNIQNNQDTVPIANNQQTLYNNIESESGINGEIYSRTTGRDGRIENEIANQRGQTDDTTISQGDIPERFKENRQRSYEEFIEYANNNKIELDTVETENLKQLANKLGINVTLFNGDGTNDYIGMTDKQNPNNVYIDINQKEIRGEDMLYHEFLHSRKRNNDSIYLDKIAPVEQDIAKNYTDIINNFIEEKGLDEKYKNYPELIAEEIIADYTSKHLGNLEIDYNLPQFYIEAINEAVNEMTNNVKANNVQESSKMQNKDIETIAPVAENQDSFSNQKNNNKYEIKQEQEQVAKILEQPTEKVKEKDRTWAILKANIIDKGIVFEELSHKTKNRELQGKWDYTLTATARGQNAIGQARYEMDPKTKTQKQISKSLEDIRVEVGNKVNDFQQYMYHQLNIDRMTLEERFSGDTGVNYERKDSIKNKPVFGESVTAEISQKIVQQYEQKNPEFKKWAKDVYDFNNANKKELVKMGVISQELSDKLAELYPHYVPIKRIDYNGNAVKVPLDTNRTGVNTPLARAKGGSSDIQPLFQTLADRTLQTYKASARNNFGVELMNTLNSIQEKQSTDIDTILEDIGEVSNNEELLKEGLNGSSPTFTVFNNGEKVTFEITKDMYDALKPLSDSSILSKTIKPLNKISNFRRGVLTEYNPLFLITNAIKDMQDVVINSQHASKTYSKFPEAYSQIINKGYWYNEYIQNGGEQNSYFKDGEFESDKKTSKLKTAIKIPLDKISSVNNVIEMAPRLAEYIASREKGASIETSMLDASRVTTNFKAGGDVTKFANRNGATFLNASVQGFQQQIRNIQEAHVKGLKGYAVLATKYAVAGLPALILNGLIWKDDDDYEELQDYVKDNYYIVAKYGDGKFVRIPKGRMAATMQKIVSNISNYIVEDKKLNIDNFAKDFWEDLKFGVDNIAPNNPLDNNVISPIIQVITNKSWYGEDIVPSRLQDKPKAEQYDESTDSLSIWLGNKLNASPYKINYLLDQYGGGVSDIALPMMTKQAENNMIEDKFTTNSVMKSKYPGEFFEMSDELKIKNNSENATDEDKLKYKYFSSVSEETSKLYKKKREIQNSTLTDTEKKKQINEVQKEINSRAKEALDTVDKLKINKNTATIGETMYYKTTDAKSKKETWKEISNEEKTKNENISLSTYASYKEKIAQETIKQRKNGNIKEDGSIKEKDKINILINSNYTQKEKQELYENYILSSTDKKYEIIKSTGLNINTYLGYKLANSNEEFNADKKDDGTVKGKTIKNGEGSAKDKRFNYINNMNATYIQKAILFGLEASPNKTDKSTIVNYISSLDGKTNKEKLDMLSRFSWITIYKDGTFDF